MSGVFYRAVSGEPLAFCQDFRDRRMAVSEKWFAFVEAKGAKGFVEGFGNRPFGLIFEHGTTIPEGFVKHRSPSADGSTIWRPTLRTKPGKALCAEFAALAPSPNNNEFAERFGVPRTLTYRKGEDCWGSQVLNGHFPYTSFVGWVGDEFFVKLPDVAAVIAERVAEGYTCEPASWEPPTGLERSSLAQYKLALAKQEVVEEAAEAAA